MSPIISTGGGGVSAPAHIIGTDPNSTPLTLTGAAAQGVEFFIVEDSAGTPIIRVQPTKLFQALDGVNSTVTGSTPPALHAQVSTIGTLEVGTNDGARDIVAYVTNNVGDPLWWVTKSGYEVLGPNSAPADAAVLAGECFVWYDQTNGAPGLGMKAKTANGTVVNGRYPLRQVSGALSTQAFVSGTAAQVATTRDVFLAIPFTGDGTNNAATLKIELSPDNVTYSTLDTLSIAAALNLTGALNVPVTIEVPAAWYVKLTATRGTIGTTTYY